MIRTAKISEDGLHRIELRREWNFEKTYKWVLWVMLNPSTADAKIDDPTLQAIIRLTTYWSLPLDQRLLEASRDNTFFLPNVRGLIVSNLYTFRATEPLELLSAPARNDKRANDALLSAIDEAEIIVCGWGNGPHQLRNMKWHAERVHTVKYMLKRSGKPCYCVGITKPGHPRHPLYTTAYQTVLPYPLT